MSHFPFPISHFLFLILMLTACRPVDPSLELFLADPAAEAIQELDLIVLHTNDTWGYYDPCG